MLTTHSRPVLTHFLGVMKTIHAMSKCSMQCLNAIERFSSNPTCKMQRLIEQMGLAVRRTDPVWISTSVRTITVAVNR